MKRISALLIIVLLIAGVFIYNSITWNYYDSELSRAEVQAMYANGEDLHCVNMSDAFPLKISYECFNTHKEVKDYLARNS